MTDLERLRGYLLEDQFPMFTDGDLRLILDLNNGDVGKAAFDGCMQKAQDDSISLGPIKTGSTEKFWLRRANMVKGMEYSYRKKIGKATLFRNSIGRFDD